MGCGSSTHVRPSEEVIQPTARDTHDEANPLSPEEITSRIVSSGTSHSVKLNDELKIAYAYVSQRGYYPNCKYSLEMCILFVLIRRSVE